MPETSTITTVEFLKDAAKGKYKKGIKVALPQETADAYIEAGVAKACADAGPTMVWIEITEQVGQFAKGQRIQKPKEAADTLIECGKAKACEAPQSDALASLRGELSTMMSLEAAKVLRDFLNPKQKGKSGKGNFREVNSDEGYELGTEGVTFIPAQAKRYGRLRSFKGEKTVHVTLEDGRQIKETMTPELRAYRFGMYCLANYFKNGRPQDPERYAMAQSHYARAEKMGIFLGKRVEISDEGVTHVIGKTNEEDEVITKAANTNNNISAGFLVPDEFQDDLIDLREMYGIFRKYAKIVPMTSDTRSDPRRRGGLQPYFTGEDQAGTQSLKNWDRVRLTAKKLMILSKWSNELNEDAIINLADDLADEIAYAFAYFEDKCGFAGDGTSAYGGIVGVGQALKNISTNGAYTDVLGLTIATGTGYTGGSYGATTLANFNSVVGLLPEYPDKEAKWFVHKTYWSNVMQRLAAAAGGNWIQTILDGALEKIFLGYPIVISQVMPKTAAGYQVPVLLGDLRRSSSFGDRRSVTISISDVALNSFEQDEMAIRGTERFDINTHDVGENTNTTTPRDPVQGAQAGPVVGLITPNA